MKKMTLYCLPYAGGSATVYHKWRHALDSSILLVPIELAGRGKRMQEPLYSSLTEAIEDICHQMVSQLQQPFMLYGHSMGSMMAYEASHSLKQRYGIEPAHLFVSGRQAPHLSESSRKVHLLSDDEFKAEIARLGGTPLGLLDNKELFDFFKPILRTDYKMVEEYICPQRDYRLDCNLTVMSGRDDDIEDESLEGWRHLTNGSCSILKFDGGHFFIHEHYKAMMGIINEIACSQITAHSG